MSILRGCQIINRPGASTCPEPALIWYTGYDTSCCYKFVRFYQRGKFVSVSTC